MKENENLTMIDRKFDKLKQLINFELQLDTQKMSWALVVFTQKTCRKYDEDENCVKKSLHNRRCFLSMLAMK